MTKTTLYIQSLAVESHYGVEPACFAISRHPSPDSVDASEVFEHFYTTSGEMPSQCIDTEVEVNGNVDGSVFAIKCGLFNNHWALLPKLFATRDEAQAWLDDATSDTLESLMPYSDLQDGMEYSDNWNIEILEIQLEQTGWSVWSDD